MSKNCQPRDSFTIWQSTLMTMQRSHLISKMGEIIKLTALGDENFKFPEYRHYVIIWLLFTNVFKSIIITLITIITKVTVHPRKLNNISNHLNSLQWVKMTDLKILLLENPSY